MLLRLSIPLIFFTPFLLGGCFGGANYAPVIERQERVDTLPSRHVVSQSETLYSIAWRYSLDFKGLARTNNIVSPYTIYPRQVLTLKPAPVSVASVGIKRQRVPATGLKPAVKATTTYNADRVRRPSDGSFPIDRDRYPFAWGWPAKGKMTRRYSSSSAIHKGIDIQGKLGESVLAANSGRVVYAGSGLVGYGKLLIIKHDEYYLSAYGHNSRLLVSEGELVKVGQKIAEFGDTGTDRVKLHFEIRKQGKPVNPLGLLTKG